MEIKSAVNPNLNQIYSKKSDIAHSKSNNSANDKFTPSAKEEPIYKATPKDSVKAHGTVGAVIGSALGRILLPALGVTAGILSSAILGPAGIAVALVGLGAGVFTESKTHAGNVALGMTGGAIGTATGKIAEKLDIAPSDKMAEATKNFSLKNLFSKLQDPKSSSFKKITPEEAKEFTKMLKPGDIIIGNNDDTMNFEVAQKIIGASGSWTHACIVKDENTVMEVLIPDLTDRAEKSIIPTFGRYEENPPEQMMTRNHHLMILRPQYKDDESIQKVIETGQSFKDVKYDTFFNMSSDDQMYCTEFVYKVLKKAVPDLELDASKFAGISFVTADNFIESKDMDVVYNSGSDFLTNYLNKYA